MPHHGKLLKDYIKRKGLGVEAFAKKLGVSRQSIYGYYGNEEFDEVLIKGLEKAGVEGANELFTYDKGEELTGVAESQGKYGRGTPILGDIDIFAGRVDITNADLSEHVTGHIVIPGFRDASYFVYVRGSSMYARYAPGDMIAIKEVKDKSEIQYGSVYVVVTEENRVLKYVRKGSDEKHLLLKSENPKFDDYEILKKNVRAMFLVLGKITKDVL